MQYWKSPYRENQDERMYREEVENTWHDIPGSKTEFRLSQPGMRMYIGATVLINRGKISGNVYEYKPMFQLRYYDSRRDSKAFSLFLNTANAQFLSTSFKILTEDSTIISFFNKSDTSGWYVKQQYKGIKAMSTISLSRNSFLEIFPEVDERKLPAYKFRWCKDDQEVICIFTKGELITFLSRLDGFINMCPMYVNIFENEILKMKLSCYTDQIAAVQNTVFTLNEKFETMLKTVEMSNEQIKNHFSTTLNSILTVLTLTKENNIQDTKNVSNEELVETQNVLLYNNIEKDDEKFIIEKEDIDYMFEQAEEDNVVDTDAFPTIEDKRPEDMLITATEQPHGYFNTPDMYVNAQLEEQEILTAKVEKIEEEEPSYQIESIAEFIGEPTVEETIPEKWEIDNFTKRINERFKLEFTDAKEPPNSKTMPFEQVYPKEMHKFITSETEDAVTIMSCVAEQEDIIKTINLDAILEKLSTVIDPNKKYTIAHHLIDTGMFTKAYIAGMLINKGRVGIPVSSIVYATSIYATAYDLIAKGEDPVKIANECGMHILQCFVEAPNISENKRELYQKYFKAIASELTGHNVEKFDKNMFVLDKMLLRDVYVYSAFDFELKDLTVEEKTHVAKALTDVYIMLHFAEKEHMAFNAQTSPNFALYFIVNKMMYRFARAMLVNLIRCNKDSLEIKNAILFNMYDMKKFCQRIGWVEEKYRDAVLTFFTLNEIVKKYVDPVIDTVEMDTLIPNTHIYRGLPCKEIMDAISKID